MRSLPGAWCRWGALFASILMGCTWPTARVRVTGDGDFFPLAPQSRWEYAVQRYGGKETFRFVATVRASDFATGDGHSCPVVDEQYGADPQRFPVVYCTENGFIHRLMSLEYKG